MVNYLARKLENFSPLSLPDRRALDEMVQRPQQIGAREDIVPEGEERHFVNVILEGWACRYKQLADGRRQIISFFLPGDMCDPYVFLLRAMDQSLGTLTPVTLARIPQDTIRSHTIRSQDLAEALWWDMTVSAEIQREWTVSLGRRTANERLAHLFCEISARLEAVGLSDGQDCELPITQNDLGDAMGLSSVHVNRTLQELRASGLVGLKSRRLTIYDKTALQDLAMFDPSYLHLRARDKRGVD